MNHNYRYVFLLASLLAAASAVAYVAFLFSFNKLGGNKAYVAP